MRRKVLNIGSNQNLTDEPCSVEMWLNSLPNDKIMALDNLKRFADNKLDVAKIILSVFDRIENTVGKWDNAGYKHFLLFPQHF